MWQDGKVSLLRGERFVHEDHPELHHYTSLNGLKGILTTNTIWATRYDYLNDKSEIKHLRPFLKKILVSKAEEFLNKMAEQSLAHKNNISLLGGSRIIANHEIENVINSIYEHTMKSKDAIAIPFITSFCSHTGEDYESQHGLLSQWRAYGGQDGRFCIVFDTKELSRLITKEVENNQYVHASLHKVIYANSEFDMEINFPDLIDEVYGFWQSLTRQDTKDSLESLFNQFIVGTTRLKHRGFEEEREVRLVLCPHIQELFDQPPALPIKHVLHRQTPRGNCPYLSLFERLNIKLPVKRIIIGPGNSKTMNDHRLDIESLFGGKFEITMSETPFDG